MKNKKNPQVFKQLKQLMREKKSWPEISAIMKLSISALQRYAQQKGWVKAPSHIKHKHLRTKVMKYFLTHSYADTLEKFKLNKSELKSVFSAAYKDPKLAHLRKDTRRKDAFSPQDVLFVLRHLGLQERVWISKKLKRGKTAHPIKEFLENWGLKSKHWHGLSKKMAIELYGDACLPYLIKTKAGPSYNFKLLVLPWVSCAMLEADLPEGIRECLKGMACFQRFLFNAQTDEEVISKIKEIVKK